MKKFLSIILVCLIAIPMGSISCFAKNQNNGAQQVYFQTVSFADNETSSSDNKEKSTRYKVIQVVSKASEVAVLTIGSLLLINHFSSDGKQAELLGCKTAAAYQALKTNVEEFIKKNPSFFKPFYEFYNATYNLIEKNVNGFSNGLNQGTCNETITN